MVDFTFYLKRSLVRFFSVSICRLFVLFGFSFFFQCVCFAGEQNNPSTKGDTDQLFSDRHFPFVCRILLTLEPLNKPTHKQCAMKYWKAFKLEKNTFNIREKHTHMHPNTRSLSLRFKLKYWFETISYGLHLSNCKIKCYENGVCKYCVFHIQTDFNVFHCVLANTNIVLTCVFLSFFYAYFLCTA